MATPHSTIPSSHPQPKFPTFHYTRRQVALMIRIATNTAPEARQCAKETGVDSSTLKSIAAGQQRPNLAVLAWLQLERCGRGFSWLAR